MTIDNASIKIDKREVLRYLGHRGQDTAGLDALIDACIEKTIRSSAPKYCFRLFPIRVERAETVLITGTSRDLPLPGKTLSAHVLGCSHAVLFAATLGQGIERTINYASATDKTAALILDACATATIESVCDAAESRILSSLSKSAQENFPRQDADFDKAECAKSAIRPRTRFSPGYGDLPLLLQPHLLTLLDAAKAIGLTCTAEYIMLPRKSVTAIVGLAPDGGEATRGAEFPKDKKSVCGGCTMQDNCNFCENRTPKT